MLQDVLTLIVQRYSMEGYNILDKIVTIPLSIIFLGIFNLVHSYGLTIIVFTIITKLVLLPVSAKGKKSMMKQSRLAPKIAEIQKKYPGDKLKQQQETQRLYAEEQVSMAGCLWNILPIPIMIALYAVIRLPLTNLMGLQLSEIQNIAMTCFGEAYTKTTYGELSLASRIQENFAMVQSHFPNLMHIDFRFLGIDLTVVPSYKNITGMSVIPIISGALSFLTAWITQKINPMTMPQVSGDQKNQAAGMTKSMLYTMPLISIWFGFIMPAAMSLYWIISSIATIGQEYFLTNKYKKYFKELDEKAAIERAAKKEQEEEERRRLAEERNKGLTQKNPNTSKRKNVKEIHKEKGAKKKKALPQQTQQAQQNKKTDETDSADGAVGGRKYARGRAYKEDRYTIASEEDDNLSVLEKNGEITEEENIVRTENEIIDVEYEESNEESNEESDEDSDEDSDEGSDEDSNEGSDEDSNEDSGEDSNE